MQRNFVTESYGVACLSRPLQSLTGEALCPQCIPYCIPRTTLVGSALFHNRLRSTANLFNTSLNQRASS